MVTTQVTIETRWERFKNINKGKGGKETTFWGFLSPPHSLGQNLGPQMFSIFYLNCDSLSYDFQLHGNFRFRFRLLINSLIVLLLKQMRLWKVLNYPTFELLSIQNNEVAIA